jgi:large subunit ribosomal protein L23
MILKNIIKNPRITEKATFKAENNVYTFDITERANKTEIKKAIFAIYKVKPVKINVLKVEDKHVFSKGKKGVKSGGRKAYVYFKKEDKIEIV